MAGKGRKTVLFNQLPEERNQRALLERERERFPETGLKIKLTHKKNQHLKRRNLIYWTL